MQRLWEAPKEASPEDRAFRIHELATFCKAYNMDQLQAARVWLTSNYEYQTWPKIADWQKAILAITPQKKTDYKDLPWIKRDKEAAEIFDRVFRNAPLAEEMEYYLVFPDYKAAMLQMIVQELKAERDGYDAVLGNEYLDHLRKKGERYRAAAEYRKTPEYLAVHGLEYRKE